MKFVTALAALFLVACGGSVDPTPQLTAIVSGVVTAAGGAPIEGASVTVGSATATTGADGAFVLQNLPVGSTTLIVTAPRFDSRSVSVTLVEGPNARDVELVHQTLFTHQNLVAYLPHGVDEYRAAIVFLPGLMDPSTGNALDSRALVRGTAGFVCAIWCFESQRMEVRQRALELAGGKVPLIGTTTLQDNGSS